MRRVVPVVAVLFAACVEQRTQGDDLFGTWSQIDVPAGSPGQQWTFFDNLTFERTGELTGSGIFHVDGTRLTVEDFPSPAGADHLAYDYVATTSHWLENAAFAEGPVTGRIGTWHGVFENIGDPLSIDYTVTLRADRTVSEYRHIVGPDRDEVYQGTGTWSDAPTGSGFRISVTLDGPGGPVTSSYSAWRLGDAIGGPLYERVSF